MSASRDALALDCAPFAALAETGAWAMTAHILYKSIDPALPATLSETVIGRVIRHAIGFGGVLVSDDLCMKALGGEPASLAQQAIAAGCDLVLHCNGDPAETASLLAGCPSLSVLAEERLEAAKARVAEVLRPLDAAALQAARDARLAGSGGGVTWLPELGALVLAAVIAITLHEAAHGYAALALGDDTAKRMGRLSLNPLRHVDPVGTLLVPGVLLLGQYLTLGRVEAVFGWAKPVPVNLLALRDPRRGMMLVAAAGPLTNFALAWLVGAARPPGGRPRRFPLRRTRSNGFICSCYFSIMANLVIGLFNLLPVPPLDGGRIVAGLLPRRLALPFMRLEPFGLLLVIGAVVVLPRVADGFDPMGWALRKVVTDGMDLVRLLSFHGGRA